MATEAGSTSEGERSPFLRYAGRVATLLVTGIGLYVVFPTLVQTFSALPGLQHISPLWFPVLVALEIGSFACAWALLRLTLNRRGWLLVGSSQLAGNAFSRIVPGGAAVGGALQYRMLAGGGVDAARIATGLTAASLLSIATLAALPVLALPALIFGAPVPRDLRMAAVLGLGVFLLMVGVGAGLLLTDGPLTWVGRFVQWVGDRVHRERKPGDLPKRLLAERDGVKKVLGARWPAAVMATTGNWLLDFLALLAALAAVGTRPRPSLVLLAYVVSAVLAMIPITPGGLGFVEAGLTATLIIGGVSAGDATLATLAYRLVSFWLPIPAGLVAYGLYRHRYGRVASPETPKGPMMSAADRPAGRGRAE